MASQSRAFPSGSAGQRGSKAASGGGPSQWAGEAPRVSLFKKSPNRSEVAAHLENVRGLVEILKLSRANLKSADALLAEAALLLKGGDPLRAKEFGDRAERVAVALEADYREATDAVDVLQGLVDKLKALGVSVADQEKARVGIHNRAITQVEFEGTRVPDYRGARALAEEAVKAAEARLGRAERASDAIFAAELAVDGAAESFPKGTLDTLQEAYALLEKARAELGQGASELATTDASVAEKIALGVMDQRRRAEETLASVEKLLNGLRVIGISIGPIQKTLEMGRMLLGKGKIVGATEVFNDAAQEAVEVGTSYRQLLDALSVAQKAIDGLRGEGLPRGEAEAALARAKVAMKAGNYALAAACAGDVQVAVTKAHESRESLKAWLAETEGEINRLRELGLTAVNDAEGMVGKAEQGFGDGDYAAPTEDLRNAGLLMKPAMNR